ncbi:G-protein coupled receptor 182 [Erinaceus europaeus]|uniref:G-protein coupled receptor 182 n=1 Tax=Erinaceus europaeus TaxID=9365 RepID=A0A1S3WRQ6_ERIEU|nr:G-protein coupled receptor 182 [Erinaceus europaeus]XP_060051104.1 G-protein coupled receptor 182 [Erinaceus europaeus]
MSDKANLGPSPSSGPTLRPTISSGDSHNWTELLYFLNNTLPECQIELSDDVRRVALFVLYLAIFVMGLVENFLVIWVNWRRAGQAGLLNFYVLHMAFADLGIVLSLPVWMLEVTLDYTWLWGDFSCRFIHYFYFVNMYSSIFFLVCLSIDRYVTLTGTSASWQRRQHQVRRVVCASVWVLSAILPLPEVVHIRLMGTLEPVCLFLAPFETHDKWILAVTLSASIFGFLLPFFLIAIFNVLTAWRLHQTEQPESRRHSLLVGAYVVVFVVCWLPYHLTLLLLTLNATHITLHCYLVNVLYFFYDIADCFSMLHCVVNPILYNFLSQSFRGRLMSAVVHYLPKVQARAGRHASSSSSSTQHSIIIIKEGAQPTAAGPQPPSLNVQAPETSPVSTVPFLTAS